MDYNYLWGGECGGLNHVLAYFLYLVSCHVSGSICAAHLSTETWCQWPRSSFIIIHSSPLIIYFFLRGWSTQRTWEDTSRLDKLAQNPQGAFSFCNQGAAVAESLLGWGLSMLWKSLGPYACTTNTSPSLTFVFWGIS